MLFDIFCEKRKLFDILARSVKTYVTLLARSANIFRSTCFMDDPFRQIEKQKRRKEHVQKNQNSAQNFRATLQKKNIF